VADTTTTAPPKQPTAPDAALLSFAIGLELAMVDLYGRAAVAGGKEVKPVAELCGANHRAAAQALSGLVGRKAPTARNGAFFSEHSKALDDAAKVAEHMAGLENAMVATHLAVLGQLRGVDGANLVASIIPTQARQAAVLVALSGKTSLDDILALDTETAIDAEKYPA
jgi:hypothetical protein